MKQLTILWISLLLFVVPCIAQGGTVTLGWDAPLVRPSGVEARLTSTATPPLTSITFDCGAALNNSCTVTGVGAGPWSAQVYAYNVGVPTSIKAYASASNLITFTMPATPPPILNLKFVSAVAINITRKEATLMAETNDNATTGVEYSIGGAWYPLAVDTIPSKTHQITLTNLRPHTTYQYRWSGINWNQTSATKDIIRTFTTQ